VHHRRWHRSLTFGACRSRGQRGTGGAWRLDRRPLQPSRPSALRDRAPPGSRPPRETRLLASRAADAPGPHLRTSRTVECRPPSARLALERAPREAFTEPKRPLSALVAAQAPARGPSASPANVRAPGGARRLHLRGQGRDRASGLERRIHGPRHPSIVSKRDALVALRLPESPSPHPSGCDPDEACAHPREPCRASLPRDAERPPHRVHSLS